MSEPWRWDETLFLGTADYYVQGRLPYPESLPEVFASAADLDGSPRLIDVGCGPGKVALMLAPLFREVVGVDPDAAMLKEAARLAARAGFSNARWEQMRAEDLPGSLGRFRYATFAQSFHWMERERVAAIVFEMLEPGGAFVHVNTAVEPEGRDAELPYPAPPVAAIDELRRRYLGGVRRAGQGFLPNGTPGNEWGVLRAAGFAAPASVPVDDPRVFARTIDDVVANVFSASATAPHLFGERVTEFEQELRKVLQPASHEGLFSERATGLELVFYRRP